VIGYLSGRSREAEGSVLVPFRKGLAETGYVEGRNVLIQFRFADGNLDRLAALASDFVRVQHAVVVAVGSSNTALAARAANPNVAVVFNSGADPVQVGLVQSFNRPGGNTTGIYSVNGDLGPKNLSLLRQLAPKAIKVAVLMSRTNPTAASEPEGLRDAAAALGLQLRLFNITRESELDAAFASLLAERPEAVVLITGPVLISRAQQIIVFMSRLGVPTIYNRRDYAALGGLMSYGENVAEGYRLTGIYTGRILKGDKAADLPVYQTDRSEFVINLKTAKALGIEIPPTLSALADEIIE
jgi:ABC-type uncharacterized transport system substrate-binding protein